MSLPVLIGLHGRRGSGKDTAFAHIAEWAEGRGLTCVRRGFADKLKHSAFLALGFQIAESDALVLADDLKTMGEITTVIPQQSVIYTISGRKFLQLFGTESHRDLFGDNFWVDALLPLGHDPAGTRPPTREELSIDEYDPSYALPGAPMNPPGYSQWRRQREEDGMQVWEPRWHENFGGADICVITDLRFENEAQRVHDLGGTVIEIDRKAVEIGDGHASEIRLPDEMIDLTIDNNGSLADLSREVKTNMTAEFHMRFVEPMKEES